MTIAASLPDTWCLISLGDLSRLVQYGLNTEADENGSGPYFLRISDIDDDGNLIAGSKKRVRKDSEELLKYKLLPGDIVIARSGSIGRSHLFAEQKEPWVFASYLIRFRLRTDVVLPDYVSYCLKSPLFKRYVDQVGHSVAQPNINSKELSMFKFPLPTLPEQHRISAILRQAEEISRLRHEVVESCGALYRTLFLEMFGDPVQNPKGYRRVPLEKLGKLDRGVSKNRPRDAPFLFGGKYPFIQTGDVANSGGWITKYTQTYSEEGLAQSRLWPEGTLCITIAANIARTGILTFDACFPDSVVGFLPNGSVTTEYVMFAFGFFQRMLEAQAPQAAQKNVNLQILSSLRIPVPQKESQKVFSIAAENIRNSILSMQDSARKLEDLLTELTLEGLTGELTAMWREAHRRELEDAARIRDKALKSAKVIVREYAPEERPWQFQEERNWITNQLSELQQKVSTAMQEWRATLIPSEDMAEFKQSWPIEHLENADDQILRTLNQLAGLGLIVKIAVPNSEGEYVTAFRGIRKEEFSRSVDIEALSKTKG